MSNRLKFLNRVVRWSLHGLEYEADQRHVELVIKVLGLAAAQASKYNRVPLRR